MTPALQGSLARWRCCTKPSLLLRLLTLLIHIVAAIFVLQWPLAAYLQVLAVLLFSLSYWQGVENFASRRVHLCHHGARWTATFLDQTEEGSVDPVQVLDASRCLIWRYLVIFYPRGMQPILIPSDSLSAAEFCALQMRLRMSAAH